MVSPMRRLILADTSASDPSEHSSDRRDTMSLLSLSGKSISMNLWLLASLAASLFLLDLYRWYSLSLGSHLRSTHQSAAALCQSLRLPTSARCRYHLLVSGFIASLPLMSNGIRGEGSSRKSFLWTGTRSTSMHPSASRSFCGRAQNTAELQ